MIIKNDEPHLLLIDGYGFVFRAYHSLPALTNNKGEPVGAVYGFTSMIMKLLHDIKVSHAAVVFDSGKKNFRHQIFEDYKANRPEAPEDLVIQFPIIRDVVKAFNLISLEKEAYEADDLIATIAKEAEIQGIKVIIISSDKDLMQLVNNNTIMFDPIKLRAIEQDQVFDKFAVSPDKVLDVLSLMGDSSDNIPGVPGIGPKTAAKLINEFGNIDQLLKNIDKISNIRQQNLIKDNRDKILLSRKLASLDENVPLEYNLDQLKFKHADFDKLLEFLKNHGFKSLIARANNLFNFASNQLSEIKKVNNEQQIIELNNKETIDQLQEEASYSGKLALYLQWDNNKNIITIFAAPSISRIYYFFFNHQQDLFEDNMVKNNYLINILKLLLEDNNILKITHDLKGLSHIFDKYNITPIACEDIKIMSFLLSSGLHGHEIDDLSLIYLDIALENGKGHDIVKLNIQKVTNLFILYPLIIHRIITQKMARLYYRLELPLVKILKNMEQYGVKIDASKLNELSKEFSDILQSLESKIFAETGIEFNLASPKQLGEVLFGNMGLPAGKVSKHGTYSTNVDILESLSEQGFTIADNILYWRQIAKLKNTYTDALIKQINPITKRLHTTFSMASVVTGRLSSSDPNLQNIPIRSEEGNKIRAAFIADHGKKLLSADYSQIELRILAHIADIGHLKEAFKEGKDIHASTASQIFSVPLEQVDQNLRRKAKAINFGIIYGISAFGLAKQLNIARSDASSYIKAYFKEYPGIEQYMENMKDYARQHGYVTSLMGRRCYVKGINDKNFAVRGFAERAAINAPMQSSAADIIKQAMVEIDAMLIKNNMQAKMILQVHDELLFEFPAEEEIELVKRVKLIMENVIKLNVPLTVGIKLGNNWAEIH